MCIDSRQSIRLRPYQMGLQLIERDADRSSSCAMNVCLLLLGEVKVTLEWTVTSTNYEKDN